MAMWFFAVLLVLASTVHEATGATASKAVSGSPETDVVAADAQELDADDNDDDGGSDASTRNGPGPGTSFDNALGAGLDVGGLQRSLKDGGVVALNKMLKAFAASQSTHGKDDAAYHITKDQSGNEVYDFRNLAAPTVMPEAPSVPVALPTQSLPPELQTPLHSEHTQSPGGSTAPVNTVHADAALKSGKEEHGLPEDLSHTVEARDEPQPADHKRPDLVVWPPPKMSGRQAAATSDDEQADDDANTVDDATDAMKSSQAQSVKTSQDATEDAMEVVTTTQKPLVHAAKQGNVQVLSASNASSDDQSKSETNEFKSLTVGLKDVRDSVDSLMHQADRAAASMPSQGNTQVFVDNQFMRRMQDLENENKKLEDQVKYQSTQIQSMMNLEQKQGFQLSRVEEENSQLKKAIQGLDDSPTVFLGKSSRVHRTTHKGDLDLAGANIRTFFHRKTKGTSNAGSA